MKTFLSENRAFTLTELLIVVTIISIIATTALISYADRKKKSELRGALSIVRMIVAAEKNYLAAFNALTATANTSDTNVRLGLNIPDGYFQNYRVVVNAGPPPAFNVTVFSGTAAQNATYTFDSDGFRLSCAGTDCIPDW